jgi:L-glyceraldehyde 3-phosphate reductase
MFDRWIEDGLVAVLEKEGLGCIVFSPLAQGLLTDRYLKEIPADSRAGRVSDAARTLKDHQVQRYLPSIRALNAIAKKRGQGLAQMALAWVLRLPAVTSALIGVSSVAQLEANVKALVQLDFSREELAEIRDIIRAAKTFVKLPPSRKTGPLPRVAPPPDQALRRPAGARLLAPSNK